MWTHAGVPPTSQEIRHARQTVTRRLSVIARVLQIPRHELRSVAAGVACQVQACAVRPTYGTHGAASDQSAVARHDGARAVPLSLKELRCSRTQWSCVDADERFRRLFQAQFRAVLAYALRRTRSREDADDVAAETFAVAWRRMDQLPGGESTLPWLYGVARRCLANQRRTERRATALTDRLAREHQSPAAESTSPVLDALERLPEAEREILRLAAWEDLEARHIALVLDITPNAAAIRLHRARRRLRAELERAE